VFYLTTRALNLGKARCPSLQCVVRSTTQGFRHHVLLRSKISHVQPPAFESLGPSCGTPCSCDTKSIDIWHARLGAMVCFLLDLLRYGRRQRKARASSPPQRHLGANQAHLPSSGSLGQGGRGGRSGVLLPPVWAYRAFALLHRHRHFSGMFWELAVSCTGSRHGVGAAALSSH
jgi:hypothetical protein